MNITKLLKMPAINTFYRDVTFLKWYIVDEEYNI